MQRKVSPSLWCRVSDNDDDDDDHNNNKLCGRPPQCAPTPCDLDLLPFDLKNGVRVTGDVGYLFLGLSVLDLGPMYATDRQTDVRQTSDSIIA